MTSEKKNKKEMKEKVMVPRRKLQSVPELLANGVNDEGELITNTFYVG
jgi:hypothetical protein